MANKKLIFGALIAAPLMLSVSGCSSSNSNHTIRVLNLDDYIYVQDLKNGYDKEDLVKQFEKHCVEALGWNDVHVIYDCSDTNESEYNDLLTGRIKYDLVCTSDYMLQKFVREDLVVPIDRTYVPNYTKYASKEVSARLDNIPVQKGDETLYLRDYTIGYMWGTLGMILAPEYTGFTDRIDLETLADDAQSWDILWQEKYYRAASIKNSMRDTYAIALMHAYNEEMEALKIQYNNGEITAEDYNLALSKIFNRIDSEKTLPLVKGELTTLKDNSFGLEVDSGKFDIISNKIGINLAWSGDAVYSMDLGDALPSPKECYYAVPENGSNLWLDGWAMPKNEARSEDTTLIALEFLNFLSDPDVAYDNMDYTGYTSFIAGDSIIDLVREWYDYRYTTVYPEAFYLEENEEGELEEVYLDEVELYYIEPNPEEGEDPETAVDFSSLYFEEDLDPTYDDVELYFYIEDEEGNQIRKDFIYVEDPEAETPVYKTYTYNDYLLFTPEDEEGNPLEVVDLSYFFEGTLNAYTEEDMFFYSDCYLPFREEGNISVGRQFFCQYPNKETINRCSVMADYGEQNIHVVKLWEDFKSNPVPTWGVILLIVEGVAALGIVGYLTINKTIKKNLRQKRREMK